LPVEAPEDGAMVALWSGDHRDEDYLDEVDRTLQKGCRKRIARKMREVTVSEVYSRPRISEKAEEMGLRKGTAFDLWTGYDFIGRRRTVKDVGGSSKRSSLSFWWFAHHVALSRTCRT